MMEAGFAGENSRAALRIEYYKMAKEAYAQAYAEFAAEIEKLKATVAAPPVREPDVRMSCLHMARSNFEGKDIATKAVIEEADEFAQYVLSGKKPGAEG